VAYQKACRALDSNAKVRDVLLQLFDDHVVDAVRSIYKDVNALLVKNSILPKIRYGVSKRAGSKAGAKGAPEGEDEKSEADASDAAVAPSEENIFAMLQNLVAKAGGGAGGGWWRRWRRDAAARHSHPAGRRAARVADEAPAGRLRAARRRVRGCRGRRGERAPRAEGQHFGAGLQQMDAARSTSSR
jgi:hypothetical protein